MFTLNMLFDPTATNGLFSESNQSNPVQSSYTWLKQQPADPYVKLGFDSRVFNPEQEPVERPFSSKGTLFIPSGTERHRILLRVAEVNTQLPDGTLAEIVVCFGKAVKAQQMYASPFTDPLSGQTITFFHQVKPKDNGMTGWILDMGTIETVPPKEDKNLVHRYEFSVGVKIGSGAQARYYGEDPEFDIGL